MLAESVAFDFFLILRWKRQEQRGSERVCVRECERVRDRESEEKIIRVKEKKMIETEESEKERVCYQSCVTQRTEHVCDFLPRLLPHSYYM